MNHFQLCDNCIDCSFDPETGEIISIEDWNGNEVSDHWYQVAVQRIEEMMDDQNKSTAMSRSVPG